MNPKILKISQYMFLLPLCLGQTLYSGTKSMNTSAAPQTKQQPAKQKYDFYQIILLKNVVALLEKELVDIYLGKRIEQYISRNQFNIMRYLESIDLHNFIQQLIVANKATITLLNNNLSLLDTVLLRDNQVGYPSDTASQKLFWEKLRKEMTRLLQSKYDLDDVLKIWAPKIQKSGCSIANIAGFTMQMLTLKPLEPQELQDIINTVKARLKDLGDE